MAPTCPVCGHPAEAQQTRYGTRHACCGLHSWGGKPLADRGTHAARRAAHDAFDPLWKSGRFSRGDAYRMLIKEMSLTPKEGHMSTMTEEMARQVPAAVRRIEQRLKEMEVYMTEKPNTLADGPIGVFDLETTGPDYDTDRIVTYAIGTLYPDGHEMLEGVVNSGVPISEGAAKVHGWTTENVELYKGAETTKEAVTKILAKLKEFYYADIPVVAFNARFDFTILARELTRCGMNPDLSPLSIVDPLVIDKHLDKYRKGSRRLDAVANHYGVSLEGWHAADADALVAGQIARKQLARLGITLDQLEHLHQSQMLWAKEQAASYQAYLRKTDPTAVIEGQWPVVQPLLPF